MTILDTRIYW